MDKFLKYLPLASLMTIIGLGAGFFMWALDKSAEWEQTKQLLHTDPAEVIRAEEHIKTFEQDKKSQLQFEAHVDDITHELLSTARELKDQRKQDSIIRMKDAITNYQTKKQVDTLIKFWKQYNASVNNSE